MYIQIERANCWLERGERENKKKERANNPTTNKLDYGNEIGQNIVA
jgi:hypothetical protein